MRNIVVGAMALLLAGAAGAAGAAEREDRWPRAQDPTWVLPEGWQAHSSVVAELGYARFDGLGLSGNASADGTGLSVDARFGIAAGFVLSVGGEYWWLGDAARTDVDFGYLRAGVGYQHRLAERAQAGAEIGVQSQTGQAFFGEERVRQDNEYARLWLRTGLGHRAVLSVSTTLGTGYRAAALGCELALPVPRLSLGLTGRIGEAEDTGFWSVGPSLRYAFGT